MPGRPPRSWFRACVSGVERSGGAYDPAAVCGASWSRKSEGDKRAIVRAAEGKSMAHRPMIAGHKVRCQCVACKALRKRRGKGKRGKAKGTHHHSPTHTRAQHKRKLRELRHKLKEAKRGARAASAHGDAGSWGSFSRTEAAIERELHRLKR